MKKRIISSCIVLALVVFAFTVQSPLESIIQKIENYTEKNPIEKAYLHLDKDHYIKGETIWFKAYVTEAKSAMPSQISNVLYVELIDMRDSITRQLRLPMENGITWGDFALPDSLIAGTYRIRAYTEWMRNEGPDSFFDKTISVVAADEKMVMAQVELPNKNVQEDHKTTTIVFSNSDTKPLADKTVRYEVISSEKGKINGTGKTDPNGKITIKSDPMALKIIAHITLSANNIVTKIVPMRSLATAADIQFLPEGGSMIENLPSRIGIKAIGPKGLGIDVKGEIMDANQQQVAVFQTENLGMGTVYLNPSTRQTYTAKITLLDGSVKTIALPKAIPDGYSMTVNSLDSQKVDIKTMMSPSLVGKGELYLIAQQNGNVAFSTVISSAKQLSSISLKKQQFRSGILQLTLFGPNKLPVAERITFINNSNNRIVLKTETNKNVYQTKEKVEVLVRDMNGKAPAGNFSVSVINKTVVPKHTGADGNILTTLLLSSDLRGYIEEPNQYVATDDLKSRKALELLMLTHGWRKPDWNKLLGDVLPQPNFLPEKGITISGTIKKNGKPLPKSRITLTSFSGGLFMLDTVSDQNGRFRFEGMVFAEDRKFIIKARSETDKKNVQIEIDQSPLQQVSANQVYIEEVLDNTMTSLPYLAISQQFQQQLGAREGITLKTVKIVGKTPAEIAKHSSNFNGPGNADQVIDGNDMINAVSLTNYLHSKISRVTFKLGVPYFQLAPLKVLVDGIDVDQGFTLNDIQPYDVESIELLISPAKATIYRMPVMLITTRRGAVPWPTAIYAPGITTYMPKGYYNAQEFYSPKYDTPDAPMQDLRRTVYWQPNLTANEKGELKFSYFNTNQPGTYQIIIEGMNAEGNLARKLVTYQVK